MNISTEQIANGPSHLSHAELGLVLRYDEDNEVCRAAADHLESCEVCQSRLTNMAGNESWWSDAEALLSDDREPRWQPDTSQALAITGLGDEEQNGADAVRDTIRELLGTPSHPEMLGRLGRYDIERVIGHGGMGIVLKAHDCELNRPIAIKLLAGHLAHVAAARQRFAREGRAAAAVVHEHVVAIHNVESDGTIPFLVMQYVPGRSLQARVDEDGPLTTEEILRISMQAAAGLAAAHRQGLVHRDVKPSNILLEDTVERAVLTDFGLARTFDDASLTHTGILAGTPHYMSPEQATGAPVDPRSDLFSLGAVLYFMATGHPPFRAGTAMAVLHRICHSAHRPVWHWNKEIPDELADVIDRLLEKKPHKRYASADEVQQRLAALLSRQQQQGLGRRRLRRWIGRGRRRKLVAGIAAVLALVATGIAAVDLGTTASSTTTSTAPTVSTAVTVSIEAPVTREELTTVAEMNRQFAEDLKEVAGKLNLTTGESFYFQGGQDPWQRELEALKRDVRDYESNGMTHQPHQGETCELPHTH
jgi:serine/threonine protein kinase